MKKYYTLLLLLILSSCDSFFHEVDKSYLKVDTQQEKDEMINGIYARLVEVHNSQYFMIQCRSDDNKVYGAGAIFVTRFPDGSMSHSSSARNRVSGIPDAISNIYINLYAAITNINKLFVDLSEQDDKKLLGELYFVRAYCYFKLARVYGTPALVNDVEVNYYLKKPSYREAYEFIESDLLKAIKLLPDTYTDARIPGETPHTGTAKALLAEVYLTMAGYPVKDESKYAEAARLAGEVIEQAEYYNFALQPDFAKLWDEDNKHDKENIFGLFFTSGSANNRNEIGASEIYYHSPDFYSNYETFVTQPFYQPQLKYFDDFPDNYRKHISFTTGYYKTQYFGSQDTPQFIRFNPLQAPVEFIDDCMSLKWVGNYQKYYTESSHTKSDHQIKSGTTLYLLRYAQTLLTYAEAKARSGSLDQSAYGAVNKIRRRANHLDLNTPSKFDLPANLTAEQFIDSVVWERAWELSCEPDGRWFDIIRLDLKDKLDGYRYRIEYRTNVPESYLTNDWYFYQIPQEDRWANPNFE